MQPMSLASKTIFELVSDNHSVAAALHFLGIHFYNYSEQTLEEICKEKGWKTEKVLENINEALHPSNSNSLKFNELPIDLLVEYLKHSHYTFIKKRLPFINDLVKNFEGNSPELKEELKLVLPLFVEDFIEHIYDEEDTLFTHILLLNKALGSEEALNKVQARLLDHSIKHYQTDHEIHEDQLKGLRRMTNNFEILDSYDLSTRVALSELKKLDDEMRFHAKVENEILFPKALQLERQVLAMVHSKISLN